MKPLISIVTIVYNGKTEIGVTIESVINQTFRDFEYIIIDGKSTDGTVEIIKQYDSYAFLNWISEKDEGIYYAMNKGIARATGEWLIFMNAGDRFASTTILEEFAQSPIENYELVYGEKYNDYYGTLIRIKTDRLEDIWKKAPFSHQSLFTRTHLLKKFPFDTQYRLVSDWDFIYKMYRQKAMFLHIPLIVAIFSEENGGRKRDFVLSLKEILKVGLSANPTFIKKIQIYFYYIYPLFCIKLKDKLPNKIIKIIKTMRGNPLIN